MKIRNDSFSEKVAAFYDKLDEIKTAETLAEKTNALAEAVFLLREMKKKTKTVRQKSETLLADDLFSLEEFNAARNWIDSKDETPLDGGTR